MKIVRINRNTVREDIVQRDNEEEPKNYRVPGIKL